MAEVSKQAGMDPTGDPVHVVVMRVAWRLMPLLVILYLVAYIDRQNISFAKLQMANALGISEVAFGFGSSLFFIGYLLFEVPSNLALIRFNARRWIARIMLTWGLVTLALAFTRSETMFYVLRFLLGAAEAGLYPGVIFYMTLWFPERYRVRMMGYFTLGSSLGNMLGSLLGGLLLSLDGLFGLQGWMWVFIVTSVPPLVLTFVVLRYLPPGPASADFLNSDERARLLDAVYCDAPRKPPHGNPLRVLVDPRILGLSCLYMMISLSIYGMSYWLPTVVKSFGVGSAVNGLLNTLPWLLTSAVLLWLPRKVRGPAQTARTMAIAAAIGIVCFCVSVLPIASAIRFAALVLGGPCLYIMLPCFWSVPPRFLVGASAAAGIAAINSLGNLGGFFGQNLMPWVQRATGSTAAPMLVPAACLLVLGLAALIGGRYVRSQTGVSVQERHA